MRTPLLNLASLLLLFSSFAAADSCYDKYLEMQATAEQAGLHYVSAGGPGITRDLRDGITRLVHDKEIEKDGKKLVRKVVTFVDFAGEPVKGADKIFVFYDSAGNEVTDPEILERVRTIGIPPAYDHVWISPDPDSHIQATGTDAYGKSQSRYHPRWNEARAVAKFARMEEFGLALPKIRAQVEHDLSEETKDSKEKLLATIVRFLDVSYIRIGNSKFAKENETYGLTTLLKSHVSSVEGDVVNLDFVGKASKKNTNPVQDAGLANAISEFLKIPGKHLFQYQDAQGKTHAISPSDVNDYLRRIGGGHFSAKDFRTWGGTTSAAQALIESGPPSSTEVAVKAVQDAVKYAATKLNNTEEICRESYIDPFVLDSFENEVGAAAFFKAVERAREAIRSGQSQLKLEEQTVLFLVAEKKK